MTRRSSRLATRVCNRRLILESLERRDVPSFFGATSYGAGSEARAVAIGDFNTDGAPDLAVANFIDGTVSILLGNGDGSFAPKADHSAGTNPNSIAVADFNGDATLDLAVTNESPALVRIMLGNGDGSFGFVANYGTGNLPRTVAAQDVDGDLIVDLVTANRASDTLSVFLGRGDGTFKPKKDYAAGDSPESLAVGEFNGDGIRDIAVANSTEDFPNLNVLLGTGGGALAPPVTYNPGSGLSGIVVGDFNGDNKHDLVVANSHTASAVSILMGTGTGTFQAPVAYPAGPNPAAIVTDDFDGDGNLDVAVANENAVGVSVVRGRGDGTFDPKVTYVAGTSPRGLATADLNGDGALDFAIADNKGNSANVVLGRGDGTFRAGIQNYAGKGNSLLIEDYTNDGIDDLVIGADGADLSGNGQASVQIMPGGSDGSFGAPAIYMAAERGMTGLAGADFNVDGRPDVAITYDLLHEMGSVLLGGGNGLQQTGAFYPPGSVTPGVTAVADFNGDGNVDIAVTGHTVVGILFGLGGGTFGAPVTYPNGGQYAQALATADLNGDSRPDLAVSNFTIPGAVSVLLNAGNGTFIAPVTYPIADNYAYQIELADFDNDGIRDIAVGSISNVHTFLGNGDGTFQSAVSTPAGPSSIRITAADFNVDGDLDIATSNNGNNTASVFLGNGNGTFAAPANYTTTFYPGGIDAADLNSDGFPDFVVVSGYLNDESVKVFLNAGNGTFQPAVNYVGGRDSRDVEIGDFDGDGIVDLAVADLGKFPDVPGTIAIFHGNGDGTFVNAQRYLINNDDLPVLLTASDLDGDADLDVIATNINPHVIYVILNDGEVLVTNIAFTGGQHQKSVASADFNADDFADLAVTNNTGAGTVNVLLGNGNGTFAPGIIKTVGTNPLDIVVADFNLDGKLDFATANYGSGTVTVWRGTGTGQFRRPLTITVAPNLLALTAADMNGDGRLDLIVASGNAEYGMVHVLLGKTNGTFQPPVNVNIGASPTFVTVGDFNNDGRGDVAVANTAAGGKVGILLGNGDGTLQATLTYVAGNTPAALALADFNDDGFLDIAVANRDGVTLLLNAADWPPMPISDGPDAAARRRADHLLPRSVEVPTILADSTLPVKGDSTQLAFTAVDESAPSKLPLTRAPLIKRIANEIEILALDIE